MAYANSSRYRSLDKFSNRYWSFERSAFDEIIDDPERYLLTQNELFEAEGGYGGAFLQLATVSGLVGGLFALKPCMRNHFINGHLSFAGWVALATTGFIGYRVGYWLGHTIAGDSDKVNHHYAAYIWQKTQNRFDGRINLMKAPMTF